MPDLVETAFFVKHPAWHRKGRLLDTQPATIAEACELAGLDRKIIGEPIYWILPGNGDEAVQVEGYQAIRREGGTDAWAVLTTEYRIVQDIRLFELLQPFLDSGELELDAAGSLKDGRFGWINAKITGLEAEIGRNGNDPVRAYLVINTAHDGSHRLTIQWTPIREVCWNTKQMVMSRAEHGMDPQLIIIHTGDIEAKLQEAQKLIDCGKQCFSATAKTWEAMKDQDIDTNGLVDYIQEVLKPDEKLLLNDLLDAAAAFQIEVPEEAEPVGSDADREQVVIELLDAHDRWSDGDKPLRATPEQRDAFVDELILAASKATPQATDRIIERFETGEGAEEAGSTVWGAYNAVTGWLDHDKGRTPDNALYNAWIDTTTAKTRERAHDRAMARLS
jgi:phage/plasmid-like protein (TIGR03299 family)